MYLQNYLKVLQMIALKYNPLALREDCTNIQKRLLVVSRQYSASQLLFFKCYAQKRSLKFYKQMDSFCLIH